MTWQFFTEVITYQHFQHVTYLLLVFARLQILVVFFLCFSALCEFQCHFYKNTFFCLNIYYKIFYLILVWRGLKSIKLEKCFFFLPTSNKFAIQNNPLMQLPLTFHKPNWKSENFRNFLSRLGIFSVIKKTMEGERG